MRKLSRDESAKIEKPFFLGCSMVPGQRLYFAMIRGVED